MASEEEGGFTSAPNQIIPHSLRLAWHSVGTAWVALKSRSLSLPPSDQSPTIQPSYTLTMPISARTSAIMYVDEYSQVEFTDDHDGN
jgi:hypothetical protein